MLGVVLDSIHMNTLENNLLAPVDKLTTNVGLAVKSRREHLGLSLRALASMSGVSASMISELERGAKSPTISTLAAVAHALDVPIAAILEDATMSGGRIKIVRAGEGASGVDRKSGARRESFGPAVDGSKVEFLRYMLPARKTSGPFAAHAKGTIEHMHVAKGSIRALFGEETVSLKAGDSCSCYADIPHSFDNSAGSAEALVYIVVERP